MSLACCTRRLNRAVLQMTPPKPTQQVQVTWWFKTHTSKRVKGLSKSLHICSLVTVAATLRKPQLTDLPLNIGMLQSISLLIGKVSCIHYRFCQTVETTTFFPSFNSIPVFIVYVFILNFGRFGLTKKPVLAFFISFGFNWPEAAAFETEQEKLILLNK